MTVHTSNNRSWIPAEVDWETIDDGLFLEVPGSDPDVLELLAEGQITCKLWSLENAENVLALMDIDVGPLERKIVRGFSQIFSSSTPEKPPFITVLVTFFLRSVFKLPESNRLAIGVGLADTSKGVGIDDELKWRLKTRWDQYKSEIEKHGEFDQKRLISARVLMDDLSAYFPIAISFLVPLGSKVSGIEKAAFAQVSQCDWLPPRDGRYSGFVGRNENNDRVQFLSWIPAKVSPSYPEVRWAIQRGLVRALSKPRKSEHARPELNSGGVQRLQVDWGDLLDGKDDFPSNFEADEESENRLDALREEIQSTGFEALAWYQPYHIWTEDSWGIFFDGSKIDDLALIIDQLVNPQFLKNFRRELLSRLAMGLVHAHEVFHARVEACLSWEELTVSSGRYLRYQKNVYSKSKGTDEWFEEALANWASWEWFQSFLERHFPDDTQQKNALSEAVEQILDSSPAGYNNWRVGKDQAIRRIFLEQLVSGKPYSNRKRKFPIENLLFGPLPYDFHSTDVPTFVVGDGLITNHIASHPNVINVPSLKELRSALRFFDYRCNKSGGKGSHEKWEGPEGQSFPLPTSKPTISPGVFKQFLHHFNLDKKRYTSEVRPHLKA